MAADWWYLEGLEGESGAYDTVGPQTGNALIEPTAASVQNLLVPK